MIKSRKINTNLSRFNSFQSIQISFLTYMLCSCRVWVCGGILVEVTDAQMRVFEVWRTCLFSNWVSPMSSFMNIWYEYSNLRLIITFLVSRILAFINTSYIKQNKTRAMQTSHFVSCTVVCPWYLESYHDLKSVVSMDFFIYIPCVLII